MLTNRLQLSEADIFTRLNGITPYFISKKPHQAIWRLEGIVRKIDRLDKEEEKTAVWNKIKEAQRLLPNYERPYILQGMFLERTSSNKTALAAYKSIRETFPYFWHAYLYAAAILQKGTVGRYRESKALLEEMVALANKMDIRDENMPTRKVLDSANGLHIKATEMLEIQHQKFIARKEAQKRKQEVAKPQVLIQIEESKARRAEMQKQFEGESQRKLEEERKLHTYNLYNVFLENGQKTEKSSARPKNKANNFAKSGRDTTRFFPTSKQVVTTPKQVETMNQVREVSQIKPWKRGQ